MIDLKNKRIGITGGNGFLGQHLVNMLSQSGIENIWTPTSKELDFREKENCREFSSNLDIIIHLAAKVGGIGLNKQIPGELFYDNLSMGLHLMEESRKAGVEKFVAIGSVCAYPKYSPVPFIEDDLWNGYPEETNAPYGLAKKMMLVQAQSYRAQYGFNAIYLLPVNLYGPGDDFDLGSCHVIPAIIRKIHHAMDNKLQEVVIWGDGSATREFLYVKDAALGIIKATQLYNGPEPVNLGSNHEISIKELVGLIADAMSYQGKIVWDTSKPNGQPRRCSSTERARSRFDFSSTTPLNLGIQETINWYIGERN